MNGFDDVSVVVLAGGRGTRLLGLYPDWPKPMIPVAGQPFLHWLTRLIALHGLRHFIYSTGYLSEQVEAWAAGDDELGLDRICLREASPLGTGGALLHSLSACRDWVLVTNGDSLVLKGLPELLALRSAGCDGGLIGVAIADASRYGSLERDGAGRLTGFREKRPGAGMINGGVYLFRKALLSRVAREGASSIEYDLFPEMIRSGADLRVVEVGEAPFIDIGTPESVSEAEFFVRTHLSAGHGHDT